MVNYIIYLSMSIILMMCISLLSMYNIMWILLMWNELEIENIILILILYNTLYWEYIWLYCILFMVDVDIINWIIIMMISYLITLNSILA